MDDDAPVSPSELRETAQKHGAEALAKLAELMKGQTTPAVQLSAARAILERGYGRPASLREPEGDDAPFTVLLENYGDDDPDENGDA